MTTTRDALRVASRQAIAARVEELFRAAGALRSGHFQLKSGRHSRLYLEKFLVLQHPAATSELCGYLAGPFRDTERMATVDVVAGPMTGGIILAFETGRQLGTRAIFAEEVRDSDGALRREFRRGFRVEPGERVLLVDDVLTTGGSLAAMLPAIEAAGGVVAGIRVIADRSGGGAVLTSARSGRVHPVSALWQLEIPTYEPSSDVCPGCVEGLPLTVPGSSGAGA